MGRELTMDEMKTILLRETDKQIGVKRLDFIALTRSIDDSFGEEKQNSGHVRAFTSDPGERVLAERRIRQAFRRHTGIDPDKYEDKI